MFWCSSLLATDWILLYIKTDWILLYIITDLCRWCCRGRRCMWLWRAPGTRPRASSSICSCERADGHSRRTWEGQETPRHTGTNARSWSRCLRMIIKQRSNNVSIEVNNFLLTLYRVLKLFTTFWLLQWTTNRDTSCPRSTTSSCFLGSSREWKHHMNKTSRWEVETSWIISKYDPKWVKNYSF